MPNAIASYMTKSVLCGNYLHYKQYDHQIKFEKSTSTGLYVPIEKDPIKTPTTNFAITRAKRNIRYLVETNERQHFNEKNNPIPTVFGTFTFKADNQKAKRAIRLYTLFIDRLKYNLKINPIYLTVPEVQLKRLKKYGKRVLHFHILFFNLPYIDNIYDSFNKFWGNGFLYLKTVKDHNTINYLTKYITKEHTDLNQKRFYVSRNIKKPLVQYNKDFPSNYNTIYSTPFSNDFISGQYTYAKRQN